MNALSRGEMKDGVSGMLHNARDAQLKTQWNQRVRAEPAKQREVELEEGRKAEAIHRFKSFFTLPVVD